MSASLFLVSAESSKRSVCTRHGSTKSNVNSVCVIVRFDNMYWLRAKTYICIISSSYRQSGLICDVFPPSCLCPLAPVTHLTPLSLPTSCLLLEYVPATSQPMGLQAVFTCFSNVLVNDMSTSDFIS